MRSPAMLGGGVLQRIGRLLVARGAARGARDMFRLPARPFARPWRANPLLLLGEALPGNGFPAHAASIEGGLCGEPQGFEGSRAARAERDEQTEGRRPHLRRPPSQTCSPSEHELSHRPCPGVRESERGGRPVRYTTKNGHGGRISVTALPRLVRAGCSLTRNPPRPLSPSRLQPHLVSDPMPRRVPRKAARHLPCFARHTALIGVN